MIFDYKYMSLEDIDMYEYYYFICDGDSKKIKAVLKKEES